MVLYIGLSTGCLAIAGSWSEAVTTVVAAATSTTWSEREYRGLVSNQEGCREFVLRLALSFSLSLSWFRTARIAKTALVVDSFLAAISS